MNESNSTSVRTVNFFKIVQDILFTFFIFLAPLIFHFVEPLTIRGYFCNDNSIRYPYHEDTVPNWVLFVVSFIIPCIVIFINEAFLAFVLQCGSSGEVYYIKKRRVPLYISSLYHAIGYLILGEAICLVLHSTGTLTVGELRPNFIAVCNPYPSTCSSETLYVETYTCQGPAADVRSARKAFPSGHSMYSFYGMVFTCLYLQLKVAKFQHMSNLILPAFQAGCITVSFYITVSRIKDNKHHYHDVLVGAAIGAAVAYYIAYVASSFRSNWRCKECEEHANRVVSYTSRITPREEDVIPTVALQTHQLSHNGMLV